MYVNPAARLQRGGVCTTNVMCVCAHACPWGLPTRTGTRTLPHVEWGCPRCSPGRPASSVLAWTFPSCNPQLVSLCPQNWLRAGHPGALGKGGELRPWSEAGLGHRRRRPCKESWHVDATQGHQRKRGLQDKLDTNVTCTSGSLFCWGDGAVHHEADRGRWAENTAHTRAGVGDSASAGCPHASPRSGRWLCPCMCNVTESF